MTPEIHHMVAEAQYKMRRVLECECGEKWLTEHKKLGSDFTHDATSNTIPCVCGRMLWLTDRVIVACAEHKL